jgi:hypothetical protein
MKASVYIETTIVSYLVAQPTKDLIQAAHQQVTRDWWATRDRFDLYVSAAVVAEARRGDTSAAARRIGELRDIPMLTSGPGTGVLVRSLLRSGALPTTARVDAAHVAIAAINGVDFLLTWNLRHLANAAVRGKIDEACRRAGLVPPIICTPEELMEPSS